MWVELHNLNSKVVKSTPEEREWLDSYLSFPDREAHFKMRKVPRWKKGDGLIHMLSPHLLTFPTGFVGQVATQAKADGFVVEVLDRRRKPERADPTALVDWLRPYQAEALNVARTVERGVFHHPTGAGKTELMVAIAELYPETKWLILTHRKDLIANTSDRFARRTGEVVGMIGEGTFKPARVTVAMFQSLVAQLRARNKRTLDFLASVRGVMIDEVHIVPAATYWRVLMALENAYFRFGFSGTPFARGDKKSIFTWGAVGPVIHKIEPETLIDAGVLARPQIRMVRVQHPMKATKNWTEAYDTLVVRNVKRNAKVVAAALKAVKPCLLFVNHVEHGKLLECELRKRGARVEFVWGKHALKGRQAAIERLVMGEVDILICNVIFQEGIDIPELQSVVIAQAGKSIIAVLQRVGRGMRKRSRDGEITKEAFAVYDFKDVGCGCPSRDKHKTCEWLEKHTRYRLAAYTSVRYSVIEETL